MANFDAHPPLLSPYDAASEIYELGEIPRSRAPSITSKVTSTQSLWHAGDSEEALVPQRLPPQSKIKHHGLGRTIDSITSVISAVREYKSRLKGWRFGVAASMCLATMVMLVNILFTIAIVARYGSGKGGIVTAINGDCGQVDSYTKSCHIYINILSSALLAASNYTQQAAAAPLREEIHTAHSQGDWLDIGVPSVRNILGRISWKRQVVWWLLASSSVPIHLLFNSAAFKSLSVNIYDVLVVNSKFLNNETITADRNEYWTYYVDVARATRMQKFFTENLGNSSLVQRLEPAECISAYGTDFVSERADVLAITRDLPLNDTKTVFWGAFVDSPTSGSPAYVWICNDYANPTSTPYDCNIPKKKKNAENWSINGHAVAYCLSQTTDSHCKLQFSLTILVVVILMNFIKAGCMAWALCNIRVPTLVTFGDAVASFLDNPDEFSRGMCLCSKEDVVKVLRQRRKQNTARSSRRFLPMPVIEVLHQGGEWCKSLGPKILPKSVANVLHQWRERSTYAPNPTISPKLYSGPLRRRWFAAASAKRWSVTLGLISAGLITSCFLLAMGISSVQMTSDISPFALGFGKADVRTFISTLGLPQGAQGLIRAILLANLPQTIISFLYLAYNGLFTSMLLSWEWSRYSVGAKKPLRVTHPSGAQKSTYYLHLHYMYSIPLLITATVLHYITSEAIFLVRTEAWRDGSPLPDYNSSNVAYSCLPILLVILLGIMMLLVVIGNGYRRLESSIPVASSCSWAIAAMTHRPKDDIDAARSLLSWGEVSQSGPDCIEEVRHCSFTSQEVQSPTRGRMYAGFGSCHYTAAARVEPENTFSRHASRQDSETSLRNGF